MARPVKGRGGQPGKAGSAPKKTSRPKAGGPKSHKSDGTPKKRWSAAERAARGHTARRSGGRPRSEREQDSSRGPDGARGPASTRQATSRTDSSRQDGTWQDGTRRSRFERDDSRGGPPRPERTGRAERSSRGDRPVWGDRPARNERVGEDRGRPRFERDDRSRDERDDRRPRFERDDRRPRFERDDRSRDERNDRRPRFERDDRRPRFARDDRSRDDRRPAFDREKPRYGRDERTDRGADRRPRFERDDRTGRPEGYRSARGERPFAPHHDPESRRSTRGGGPRGDDRSGLRRDDRGSFRRDDRSDYRRDDRSDFRRDDRGGFRRDDRSDFRRGDRGAGGGDRRDRRPAESTFGDHSEADQMSWAPAEAVVTDDARVTSPGFADLGLRRELVAALNAQGITDPFPIQSATIPDALTGRDVLGRGQTGSGKTLGFGLPTLTRLAGRRSRQPGALVLVPTRELAMQVADVLSPLAGTVGLSVMLVAGGMAYGPQIKAFARGVDIVVATPGRLIDLMDQGAVDLSEVEVAVLDEADHMADLGFLPDVRRILDAVPAGGQRLLFSATLDRGVDTVVREYLNDPVTHEVDPDTAAVSTMEHHLLHIKPADKQAITAEISNRQGRTLVFARTQRGADRIAEQLREAGVMAGALHGGLTQGARSRILAAFKAGTVPVLVATDVAARGIHVDDVGLVLQVDPAAGAKDYLHRAGRTARAGGQGVVVSLVLPHQRREMSRLTHRAGVHAAPHQATPDDEHVYRATGARQPSRGPIEQSEYDELIAPPRRTRKPAFRGRGHRGGRRF